MKETKVYPQSEADQDFAKLLKNMKNRRKCIIRPVSDGINECQPACKIENGERPN